jgi:hypothetical protein
MTQPSKFIPLNISILAEKQWHRIKIIKDRDIKKAIAIRVGSIAKFDVA